MKHYLKRKIGLTLIELLVALSIFAVALSSIYAVFRTGTISSRRIQEHIERYQPIRFILEQLSTELRNAIYYPDIKFEGTSISISFVNLVKEPANIKYSVKQDENLKSLLKETALYRNLQNPSKEVVLQNILNIKFSYCYKIDPATGNYQWEDTFDKEDILPGIVRIEIEPQEGENKITKFVYIPTGTLEEE